MPVLAPVEEGIDWGNVFQKAGALLVAGIATAGACGVTVGWGCVGAGAIGSMFVTEQFHDAEGEQTTPAELAVSGTVGAVAAPLSVFAGQGLSAVFSRGATSLAAKAEAPLIKVGSAGGESAGKVFPQAVKDAARAENPGTCVYCRMGTDSPQIDHAIPRVRGGNATLDNAQTTCAWCNASKGARDFPVNPPPGFRGDWPPVWWGLP
jgi:hypothetical protein